MPSLITTLQDRVTDRLASNAELRGSVAVLARKPKQTLSDIDASIAQLKLGLFVFPPLIKQVRPNSTGLFAEEIEVRVSCFENPVLNDTPLDVYRLVELVLYLLHHWDTKLEGVTMVYASSAPVQDTSTDALVVFDTVFLCSGGFEPRPDYL